MEAKMLEIRDAATMIPAMGVRLYSEDPVQEWYLQKAGLSLPGSYAVLLTHLQTGESHMDPHHWKSAARTMAFAHNYIETNWEGLRDGDVIDVQYLLRETSEPKISERLQASIYAEKYKPEVVRIDPDQHPDFSINE